MELVDLRYFDHVARAGSFAAGAKGSHVSPPAITKAIQRLEAELGTALFARTTRRVSLTEAGRLLQVRAREVLDRVDSVGREIEELGDLVRGELHVAAMEVFSIYLLPAALGRFVRAHPEVVPHVYEMITQLMEEGLRSGRLDVGFTVGYSGSRSVRGLSLGRSRGLVVCGRGHPLAAAGRIRPSDLERHPFVVPRFYGLEHLPVIDRFPDDVHPRRVGATIELLQMGIQLVVGGDWLGYFPEITIRHHLRDGSLIALRGLRAGPPFDLLALYPAGPRPRRGAPLLVEEVRRVVARNLRRSPED